MVVLSNSVKEALDHQRLLWENIFSNERDFFTDEASEPAKKAMELFKKEGKTRILELGGGQGRDTFFFANNGFHVAVLDYSREGIKAINGKAQSAGLSRSVQAFYHDVRTPLPFPDESFDACYSHMLFCMALTNSELEFLAAEVRRVLKPAGLCIYTVRHTGDPHYRTGIHRGGDMYEHDGFIVHFFSKEKVEHLAEGYELMSIDEFEEGELPRKLFRVTLRKGDAE